MNPIRVGILGTGTVVRSFHLPALAANSRARIIAFGNLHEASLQSMQVEFANAKAYTDFDRMADDPEIDAVVNALPNYLHEPVTVQMLARGKHVLCEKPMAMTVAEAGRMVAAAKAANRKLMIGHVWRCHPEVQWLRKIVSTGTLGTINRAVAHAIVAGRGPAPDSWFVCRQTAGGGALADVGIHVIDTMSFLLGDHVKPVRLTARTENRFQGIEVEDTASVSITYSTGMTCQIEAGWYHSEATEPHGAIELFGTNGYARILPARLDCRDERSSGEAGPVLPSGHPDENLAVYAAQMDHFLDCILNDRRPLCDGEVGLADMVVLEAAYKAAASGGTIAFNAS